jgi:hypothetical protein
MAAEPKNFRLEVEQVSFSTREWDNFIDQSGHPQESKREHSTLQHASGVS